MSHRHIVICDRCKKEVLNTANDTLDEVLSFAGWIEFDLPLPTKQLADVENGCCQSAKVALCRHCHISLNLWWGMGLEEGKALALAQAAKSKQSEEINSVVTDAVLSAV